MRDAQIYYMQMTLYLSLFNCSRRVRMMWRWCVEGGMDGWPRDVEPVQSSLLQQSSSQPPSNQIWLPKTHHMFGEIQFEIWRNTIYNLDKHNLQPSQATRSGSKPKTHHMLPASVRSPRICSFVPPQWCETMGDVKRLNRKATNKCTCMCSTNLVFLGLLLCCVIK